MDNHDKELMDIRTEFGEFKENVSEKLDELFKEIRKPIFTDKQIITTIIGVIVYLVIAVSYVNKTDARSLENYNNIKKNEAKNDKIYDILITIKEDVANLKPKQ